MSKCYLCQKNSAFGHNVSHSKRRTKRVFKANLHQVAIGAKKRLVCARCMKKMDYTKL